MQKEQNVRLVLASASPRRRELLSQIGLEFTVMPSTKEENAKTTEAGALVQELSRQKAVDIWEQLSGGQGQNPDADQEQSSEETQEPNLNGKRQPELLVIGADTVVCCEGKILGKPHSREAAAEMLDYKGCGMSVMEMSHRSQVFDDIIKEAEQDLRDLMHIPDNYKVLFLQGGASQQFAMIPMNLMKNKVADYIVTGQWAKKAYQEAQKYGKVNKIATSEDKTFSYIPDCSDLPVSPDADYVYICENNTIYGTKFKTLPNTKGKTLVADVSSCFLSEPVDVTKYGIIYGGVQKNIGPAGMVISIIREDLITDEVLEGTPTMLKFKTHADAGSLYNTPNCYCIYMCGKVFKWLKKMGGLEVMKERNEKKAKLLYDYLDSSKLFKGTVEKDSRSLMNVPFVTGDKDLDAKFVKEAKEAGLENLKGHRTVGGMRASIYNAMPYEGVEALVAFMKKFEEENL